MTLVGNCNEAYLGQLVSVIKGHEMDTMITSITNVFRGLARIGKDDVGGGNTESEHRLNFTFAGTIKASSEGDQSPQDLWVSITFDGVEWFL